MGNSHRVQHSGDATLSLKRKKDEIEFKHDDFIRESEGSIEAQYEILSPPLEQNEFYQRRKAIHRSTTLIRAVYIIKKYKLRSKERELLQLQISKLKKIDHPNVSKIYELFKGPHRFYVVTELSLGQSLNQVLETQGRLDEKQAIRVMWQLLYALSHCHKKGIAHTDLKFESIVFTTREQDFIEITDFSVSHMYRIQEIIEQTDQRAFLAAPEALNEDTSIRSDMWSCGVIIYTLLTGTPPFLGGSRKHLIAGMYGFVPSFSDPAFKRVSKEAKTLIRRLLCYSANSRPTAEQCLQSDWLRKYEVGLLSSAQTFERCIIECCHYQPKTKLQEATWTFFVNALVSLKEKQSILTVFLSLDRNKTGYIDKQDIEIGLRRIFQPQKASRMARIIISYSPSGFIQYSRFITICTNRELIINEPNIVKIFRIFDRDNSGEISVSELRDVLGSSKQISEEIWLELMKEADANSDGMISLEEFKSTIQELRPHRNLENLKDPDQKEALYNTIEEKSDFMIDEGPIEGQDVQISAI